MQLNVSWHIGDDIKDDLASLTIVMLTPDSASLGLNTRIIPAINGNPEITVSTKTLSDDSAFKALLWHFAGNDNDLVLEGVDLRLRNGVAICHRNKIVNKMTCAEYLFSKIGMAGVTGPLLQYTKEATRLPLEFSTRAQYAIRTNGIDHVCLSDPKAYCVIDLTTVPYGVSYTSCVPTSAWGSEMKTTKMLFRRINSGTCSFKIIDWDSETMDTYHVRMQVTRPYYIGVYPVTQSQYERIMGNNPSANKGEMHPVESVSWNDIRGQEADWPATDIVSQDSFVGVLRSRSGLKFDLPTEAQWRLAASGGFETDFANGGNEFDDIIHLGNVRANAEDYGVRAHCEVGCFMPNAFGLYDCHGNISEMCLDYYDYSFPERDLTDPIGPSEGYGRVTCGEDCNYYFWPGMESARSCVDQTHGSASCGFRLAIPCGKEVMQ